MTTPFEKVAHIVTKIYCLIWVATTELEYPISNRISSGTHDVISRYQRQLIFCSNGIDRAVATCFLPSMTCNGGFQCERATGLCCPVSVIPTCPNGLMASAMCFDGVSCNGGLQCIVVNSIPVCCRSNVV